MTCDVNNDGICLACVMTNVVCDMLDNGSTIPRVWEVVKDAIEQWQDEQ